jgi:biopolymer transport protein ExbB
MHAPAYGIAEFLVQADAVGKCVAALLLAMSLASWYLILVKSLQAVRLRRRSARFLAEFWDAPSLAEVERRIADRTRDDPFSRLAWNAISALRHYSGQGVARLSEAGGTTEVLTRAMRRVIEEETARAEGGLTLLASVGSTAPFVGLFGTVWGVYHALVAIGISGQGTLDKVAGPVGEALIMTGLGLAVAIPAVLAYNAFVRANRLMLSRLDSFAHDMHALLTTGTAAKGKDA